jgi:hypothetical protein
VAQRLTCGGKYNGDICFGTVGNENLGSIDNIFICLSDSSGAQGTGIAPRTGFGQCKTGQFLPPW